MLCFCIERLREEASCYTPYIYLLHIKLVFSFCIKFEGATQEKTYLLNHIFPRLEQAKEAESKDALKDLVNLITSLTTYGVSDLKPAGVSTGAPFLLPGFAVPQPAGKGEAFFSFFPILSHSRRDERISLTLILLYLCYLYKGSTLFY